MNVLPNPQKFENISGSFTLNADSKMFCNTLFTEQAERFADLVYHSCGFFLQFTDVIEEAQIIFSLDSQLPPEGYVVMIAQGIATVTCSTVRGCFYAVETLRQLFNLDSRQQSVECSNCYVEDSPKFAHRGLLVDVCRHFYGVETLKKIIELMSQVKLNKLHLHLSDDQGFRLQIDKYPLLTEVGATRQGTEVVSNGKRYIDEQPHGGFLTKEDVVALVQFANKHCVEVIPEFDLPGHFVAALAAYPQFSCTGSVSEVRKSWGISKDILCAGNDASYEFVKDILDEICELFPSEYVHLGGDEVPKDRWCNCKLCRERMAELKLSDYDELQTYMVEVFRQHLEQKGKKVICWNDGITKSTSCEIVSQVWKPLTIKHAARQTKKGRQIIVSPYFHTYFGFPYAMTSVNKTLKLNPFRGVPTKARNNVLGVEGAMWTEYIDSEEKLFFHLLPRLDALSECAWGSRKQGFGKRVKERMQLYASSGLVHNSNALAPSAGRLRTVKKFFRRDSDVEFKKNKQIDK